MSDEVEGAEVEETEDGVENEVEDTEENEAGEDDFTPPSKDEWTKLTNAAKARKKERDDARRELAALRAKESEGEQEPDEASKWRETAARSSAAVALQSAGFSGSPKQARRLTRLLDLSGAEADEFGDFDFEDEIEELKEEFPQLFAGREKAAGRPVRRPTTADRGGNAGSPAIDKHSEKLLRMAGYR